MAIYAIATGINEEIFNSLKDEVPKIVLAEFLKIKFPIKVRCFHGLIYDYAVVGNVMIRNQCLTYEKKHGNKD